MTISTLALIGFGEVGQVLAAELGRNPHPTLQIYDPQLHDRRSSCARVATRHKVLRCRTAAEAATGADLVISAVTAAQTVEAASSVAAAMKPGAWFLDLNSASPAAKIAAAEIVSSGGGCYVEAALMSPIEPKRLSSPVLLGGPHAEAFVPHIMALGFERAAYYSDIPGKTAAAKLCRSIMVKGLEALASEALLAARHYAVEDTVLASLNDLFPHPDWEGFGRYLISRTLQHGARRAEEMEEAAKTVSEAGVTPWMSLATVQRQAWAPAHADALDAGGLKPMLDIIRSRLPASEAAAE